MRQAVNEGRGSLNGDLLPQKSDELDPVDEGFEAGDTLLPNDNQFHPTGGRLGSCQGSKVASPAL